MANYKKSTRCFICAVQTNGMFNPAKELIARMARGGDDDDNDNGGAVVDSDTDSE